MCTIFFYLLLNLAEINLDSAQQGISNGKRVNSAKDDAAVLSINAA
ncbi:MAG: hypothetical protein MUE81_15700 [Thermoflexibacter sp.]|jgi:flagellin-like hook-associated protein FlgL|nr:hypothetical protein [Thermoflexibacter sp.]